MQGHPPKPEVGNSESISGQAKNLCDRGTELARARAGSTHAPKRGSVGAKHPEFLSKAIEHDDSTIFRDCEATHIAKLSFGWTRDPSDPQ
jgi:hypothetical protein